MRRRRGLRRRALFRRTLTMAAVLVLSGACGAPVSGALAAASRKKRVGFLSGRQSGACLRPEEWLIEGDVALRRVNTPLPDGCDDYTTPMLGALAQRGYRDGENLEWIRVAPVSLAEERPAATGSGTDIEFFIPPAVALAAIPVDLIVARGGPPAFAAKKATASIPIVVFGIADVVETGLVESVARPGGNVTGVSVQAIPGTIKRLETLKEAFPWVRRPVLVYGAQPSHVLAVAPAVDAGRQLGMTVVPIRGAGTQQEFMTEAARALNDGADSLTMVGGVSVRTSITELIRQRPIPTVLPPRWIGDGIAVIGLDQSLDDYPAIADYVDRILRGADPADLPIVRPLRWDLVVDLKAASAAGLAVAPSVVARATKLIR